MVAGWTSKGEIDTKNSMTFEQRQRSTLLTFHEILVGWWRDPYFMAYITIPKYNWIVFHPLYQTTNQGFVMASYWYLHMGVSKNTGTPKWMVKIMKNPIKMDDLGA